MIFGYPTAEILEKPLKQILPALPSNGATETTALTADGVRITVSFTQTRIPGTADEPPITSLILRDITAERERAAIVEEERARIARDLHDGVAQTLYFLALNADMAAQQLASNPQKVGEALHAIGQKARAAIRDVRRTIFALRPLDWASAGFLPALHRFVHEFGQQSNLNIKLETNNPVIPERLEPTLFRLIQESLNNVAKHAEAEHTNITIQRDENNLRLTMADDGRGFAPPAENGGGLGLRQMRQRVQALSGEFTIDSAPASGTIVTVILPV